MEDTLLTRLERREKELREELSKVNREIEVERLRIAKDEYKVEIGLIVVHRGEDYKVVGISFGYGKPWLKGNPRRKDGNFGTSTRNLYSDWTIKNP